MKIFDLSVENADLGHNFSLYRPSSGARKQDIFILKRIGSKGKDRSTILDKTTWENVAINVHYLTQQNYFQINGFA